VRAFDIARSIKLILVSLLLASSLASAQNATPAPRPDEDFSFMKLLADKSEHDIENES
jgi:hypothetical protein